MTRLTTFVTARRKRGRMKRLYATFVRAGDLVFDVGANVGNRVEVFLDLGATVVAVEPQRACVDELERRWRNEPRLRVVAKALGAAESERELYIADVSTISTMSPDWISATTAAGRFGSHAWDRSEVVPVTTLDRIVAEHGRPAFCKIDVEGFELEVLRGLTRPLPALSLEFAREFVETTAGCIDRLEQLGDYEFNYSLGESMALAGSWTPGPALRETLARLEDPLAFGDVYARLR